MTYSATISVVPFNGKILFVSWQFIHSAHHQGRALGDAVTLSVSQNPHILLHAAVS